MGPFGVAVVVFQVSVLKRFQVDVTETFPPHLSPSPPSLSPIRSQFSALRSFKFRREKRERQSESKQSHTHHGSMVWHAAAFVDPVAPSVVLPVPQGVLPGAVS